jgi:hypothetical protein
MNLPTLIPLPKAYTPERVMADATQLRLSIEDYFSLIQEEKSHPTPPGLAMAMGLRGFDALMQIMKTVEDDPTFYPEDSTTVLYTARSYLEDYYLRNGLRESIPQAFTKFIMSAYFNRSEKTIQEQLNTKDNNIQISILGVSEPMGTVFDSMPSAAPSQHDLPPTYTDVPTIEYFDPSPTSDSINLEDL